MKISAQQNDLLQTIFELVDLQQVYTLAGRLQTCLGNLHKKKVAIAYGGGKDSSYIVALVRAAQLLLLLERSQTFSIVIIVNNQSHMTPTVMQNINNTLSSLQLYDDDLAEIFIVNGVNSLRLTESILNNISATSTVIKTRDRTDLLMAGHLTRGEPRRMYCDFCNLYMQLSELCILTSPLNACDLLVTGDSLRELAYYRKWIEHLYRFVSETDMPRPSNFAEYMDCIAQIAKKYFVFVHGHVPKMYEHLLSGNIKKGLPKLFSVYSNVKYPAEYHLEVLNFLNFKFSPNDLTAAFTESDCSAPALMWHLHSLKCQHLNGRTYEDGAKEYVKFATGLMTKKQFPKHLIHEQEHLYTKKINDMRDLVGAHYKHTLGLTDENLVCIIYSPFTSNGENLIKYLKEQQPALFPYIDEILKLLEFDQLECSKFTIDELEKCSGLTLGQLRLLYRRNAFSPRMGRTESSIEWPEISPDLNFFQILQAWDPHKSVIQTSRDGDYQYIELSGR